MEWNEVTVTTTTYGIEHVTGALLDLRLGGFSIRDAEDFEEFLTDTSFYWDYIDDEVMKLKGTPTQVIFYIPKTPEGADTLANVRTILDRLRKDDTEGKLGSLDISLNSLKEEDWSENWKQYFKPIPVGDRLIIKPSWENLPAGNTRTVLEIDPKMSFGTGTHDTTRLCLEVLDKTVQGGEKLLDMGCGSGILSIGALLLGAQSAFAVDVDPLAAKTAGENARINRVEDRITIRCGDVLTNPALAQEIGTGYDLICANIVSDVLIAMTPFFTDTLRPGGRITVSGIIEERADEVLDVLKAAGFTELERNLEGGWCAAVLTH